MPDLNSMQAGMGLSSGGYGGPSQPYTPSPGETSLRLMAEANARSSYSGNILANASMSVARQFQTQFQGIQASQSYSPHMAQALSMAQTPGYSAATSASDPYARGGSMLPSPLLMTPPSTGSFRPPPQQASYGAIPPMALPPISAPFMGPFGAQMPSPMFRSPMEQQSMASDMSAYRMASYTGQAPGVMAAGASYGMGAFAGARMGASFGAPGALIGAGLGAMGVGMTGIPQMASGAMQSMMGRPMETVQMGAALQSSSQNWVTGGPSLSGTGRGLDRSGAMNLAGGIRDMAANSTFQDQTGMNRGDLMQIVKQGGSAGLFDMAQSIPDIKNKLRETAQTIKQFMALTSDPDISNVIRQMGQMNQMGMSQGQMVQAAAGAKMYARQAGTTTQGLSDIGGAPGAYTYQQAGLTAGVGYQYGNYAAAAARNAVSTGNMTPQSLSLLGGVSGMTQRDIQSQAAFTSMPMFAAMNAKMGSNGSWGADRGAPDALMGRGGGAFGMVSQAYQNISQGVAQGGVGALATFGLEKHKVADAAAAMMTPEQQMTQRFQMARDTGKVFQGMGMGGKAAFNVGATVMYGEEAATQMSELMGTPGFVGAQHRGIQARRKEVISEQRAARKSRPILGDAGIVSGAERMGRRVSGAYDRVSNSLNESWEDFVGSPDGTVRIRRPESAGIHSEAQRENIVKKGGGGTALGGDGEIGYKDIGKHMDGIQGGVADMVLGGAIGALVAPGAAAVGLVGSVAAGLGIDLGISSAMGLSGAGTESLAGFIATGAGMDPRAKESMIREVKRERAQSYKSQQLHKRAKSMTREEFLDTAKKTKGGTAGVINTAKAASEELKKQGAGSWWEGVKNGHFTNIERKDIDKAVEAAVAADPTFKDKTPAEQDQYRVLIRKQMSDQNPAVAASIDEAMEADKKERLEEKAAAVEVVSAKYEGARKETAGRMGLGTGFWQDDALKDLTEVTADSGAAGSIAMAAAASGEVTKEAEEAWKKAGGKGKLSDAMLEMQGSDQFKGLSEDAREGLAGVGGKKGGYAALAEFANVNIGEKAQKTFRDEGVHERLGGFMSADGQSTLNSSEKITEERFASFFDDEGLKRMEGSGDAGKKRAALYRKVKSGKGTAEDKAAMRTEIEGMGSGKATEEESTGTAEGKEAADLDKSDNAVADLGSVVSSFNDAVTNFAETTKTMNEIMQYELAEKRQ